MIANRDRGLAIARRGQLIAALGLVLLAGVYVLAQRFTPTEVNQGLAQKIFYLHVPAAWTSLLVFSIVGITSALYLWLRDERLDLFAASSAEVGVVFSIIMLTTGPLWAKPIWGTWWQWDARLTLTLFLFFLFVGYLSLRAAVPDPGERARFSAVVAILGFLLVPFVHLSVYLFRTIHPMPVVLKPSAPSLPDSMLRTLLIAFAVDLVLYIGFVTARYGLGLVAHARAAELEARPDA
ncbi:MAG TPA: cytochrome c biogenesis protein CcsA [Gemmatimonadales bacterium]|jgi:heme exporter protein C|nr:cytochrome c biogenesis protein CcsA [Gemmatimonadales bacterium]